MKKILKWVAWFILGAALIIIIAVTYIVFALPDLGKPENIKVELTPERIKRGEYLVKYVVPCTDCHSPRFLDKFGGPIDTTRLGAGGGVFDNLDGFPGHVVVPDITPAKLKDWTDGELFRTITEGVKKDGTPIFPLMPWPYFSKMDRQDVYDIIAYIRTLKPIEANYPKAKLNFPLNILVHTMPKKATLGTRPDPKDTVKYGGYLVQIAACQACHSQESQGTPIPGLEFAGGRVFIVNGNTLRAGNISPDNETGIGKWSKKDFISRFRIFTDPAKAAKVGPADFQTVMPWWVYSGMKESDLASIYAYLRTVKPVKNAVVKFQLKSGQDVAAAK